MKVSRERERNEDNQGKGRGLDGSPDNYSPPPGLITQPLQVHAPKKSVGVSELPGHRDDLSVNTSPVWTKENQIQGVFSKGKPFLSILRAVVAPWRLKIMPSQTRAEVRAEERQIPRTLL